VKLSALDEQNAIKSIENAHKQFNSITADFMNNGNCDLAYRIGRSRHYVGQVRSNVEFLRIKRLEGYQPYDQFVERRLGGEFDFIDSLGGRYERAANNISMLDQNYLSIETERVAIDTADIQEGTYGIQKAGEFASLAFLVPYYVSHILAQILPESVVPIMTIGTWTGFLALAFYKISKNYIPPVGILCGGVCFGVLFAILVNSGGDYSTYPRFPDTPSEQLMELKKELKLESEQLKELKVESELLKAQNELGTELLETQRKQLNVQRALLDAQIAEPEKKEDAPPHLPPTHRKRVQKQHGAH
jgi:hypothetical protein